MNPSTKLTWLKRVLLVKVAACLFFWGLPALLGSASFLKTFGVTIPADPIILRSFGAVTTALALLYGFAYRDPVGNRDIIKYAVFDNGLATLTVLLIAFTTGLTSWFYVVSGVLTALFTVAFWVLMPKK